MAEIYSQSLRAGNSRDWTPSRAAGLYGELPLLPLPIAAPVPALKRRPRPRPDLTD
jgi:hypothetical protein